MWLETMKSRLPKGYGGGAQNMQGMIKQAQKMQDNMAEVTEQLEAMEFSATVGGGAVEITMTGKKEVKALSIKPEVVDPEDIEMLQDLLIAAYNEVMAKVDTTSSEMMSKVTGGFNVPGMPGMF